ncbi:unnamed protein product [Rotaria magnacalcarata]
MSSLSLKPSKCLSIQEEENGTYTIVKYEHIVMTINIICNHQLRLLCFSTSTAEDQMIEILQTNIHSEKYFVGLYD